MPEGGDTAWGPERCADPACAGPLPRGLITLGRTRHVDCAEARAAWQDLAAAGKTPGVRS